MPRPLMKSAFNKKRKNILNPLLVSLHVATIQLSVVFTFPMGGDIISPKAYLNFLVLGCYIFCRFFEEGM